MAVRFQIGPGHYGLNLDQSEEILLVHALEAVRPKIPKSELWLVEFDKLFFESDRGLSEQFLEQINRHLRRLGHGVLSFEETDWTDYMHRRGAEKTNARQSLRQAVGTPQGERQLTWASGAAARLAPRREAVAPRVQAPPPTPTPAQPPLRDKRSIPVLGARAEEAMVARAEAAVPDPVAPEPALAAQTAPQAAPQTADARHTEVIAALDRIEGCLADTVSALRAMTHAMEQDTAERRRMWEMMQTDAVERRLARSAAEDDPRPVPVAARPKTGFRGALAALFGRSGA